MGKNRTSIFKEEKNIERWDKIPLPSCWQLYGYENPVYSDIAYPYPVDAPYVPDENPLGIYMREFEIEKELISSNPALASICKTKYPIVLVHGIFFRDSKMFNYWGRVPNTLKLHGATIY